MSLARLVAVGALTALTLVYFKIVRPWTMRWGATDEEVARSLPGDSIVEKADFNATRAITIDAPPELVWPPWPTSRPRRKRRASPGPPGTQPPTPR